MALTCQRWHKAFDNNPKGFICLQTWCRHTAPDTQWRFALEAASPYGEAVAEFLAEANYFVSVLNPHHVQLFGLSLGAGNKTDPQSAKVIALFAKARSPALWKMARSEVKRLKGLARRRQTLLETRTQELNRLQTPGHVAAVVVSLQNSLQFLNAEIAARDEQIDTPIDNTPSLKADKKLLLRIPGIAERTAITLRAELPDLSACNGAASLAAYAGLAPAENRSGRSVHGKTHITRRGRSELRRFTRRGRSELRRCLYLPAVTATRYNPLVKALYARSKAWGHSGRAAVVAGMRKLLMLVYGVLKTREPFNAAWPACAPTAEA